MSLTEPSGNNPIEITSLNDLRKYEPEIVARINRAANGARLFLADPIRLFKELNVLLTPAAERALEQKLGAANLAANPLRRFYDEFKRSAPDTSVTVTVRGILPKEAPGA